MKQLLRLRVVSFFLTLLGLLGFARDAAGQLKADFNGDGIADLAVGVPFEDVGTIADAGVVNVLYGLGSGLSAAANQLWHQDRSGVADAVEVFDNFGWALAAGDFNFDDIADLAVGVPGETLGTIPGAGAVSVLYGSGSGLSAAANQLWHQDRSGVADVAEGGDSFGWALAAGDFNGDGIADLAVGVPGESVGTIPSAGAVNVLYGSRTNGLSAAGNQLWHQNSTGVADVAEDSDQFGQVLYSKPND